MTARRDSRTRLTPFGKGALRAMAVTLPALAALALFAPAARADVHDARDTAFVRERRTLETARYLHDIEGDTARARAMLDRLKSSRFAAIRAQTLFLRAGFREEAGDRATAARLYKEALEAEGLEPAQKQRLVARLLSLNPESVRPFRDAGRARGLPVRVFESVGNGAGNSEYVIVEEADPGRAQGVRLSHQDAEGRLRALPVNLAADEDVLDAAPDRILTRVAARQRVIVRMAPRFRPEIVLERFPVDEGHIFAGGGETPEILLIGTQGVRVLRGESEVYSHALPGPGCVWNPSTPRARQGILFCPDQAVFRADFSRRLLTNVPLSGDPPAAVLHAGESLALRYSDRIEFRRGPGYDAFVWGFPSSLQDVVALGRSHAFIAATDGPLRAFSLRSGQLDWQRDDGASTLRAHGGDLLVLTHARVLLAVDERGRQLYAYETGWDGDEPALLPTRDWVVVQNADGRRVGLSRELMRLTGGSRDHLLRGERESLRRGDARGALRELDALLALEPGNGTAWREKARLLAATGAARAEQARAWTNAARSHGAAPWSADPAFTALAGGLGASWVWKRQPGPRFFPVLTGGRQFAFYIENDNQTVVVLDARTGTLKTSFRFPEPLDLKITTWTAGGDTLLVSSPTRLYVMVPGRANGIATQIPLRNPVSHSLLVPEGILVSDWNGNLQRINLATRETLWEARLGRGGLLLARAGNAEQVDVFEVEGGWHRVRLEDGKVLSEARMPPGTITEVHAGRDVAVAGYNEGLIVAMDKQRGAIAWQRDMGEQIFSLSGRGDQFLLVGTASKRVLTIHGRTGLIQSQAQVPSHLFNRPLLAGDGYWVGTAEPALEKRSLTHEVLVKYPLTDMPGTPSGTGGGIAVSTQDNFILVFPGK